MYVPRYKSPKLVDRMEQVTLLTLLGVFGYVAVTGDGANVWCGILLARSLLFLLLAGIREDHVVTRDRLDRLVARLANKRERRRAMKAAQGT